VFQEREPSICCSPVVCSDAEAISAPEPVSQYLPVPSGLRFEREIVVVLEHAALCKVQIRCEDGRRVGRVAGAEGGLQFASAALEPEGSSV